MNLQIALVFLIGIISALTANLYDEYDNYDDPMAKTKGISKIFFLCKAMLYSIIHLNILRKIN